MKRPLPIPGTITIGDKIFEHYLSQEEIAGRVLKLAQRFDEDYSDLNPLIISVLNGAFIFTADLIRKINTDCQVSFVKIESYQGTNRQVDGKMLIGLSEDVRGRHILLLEDIIDTGHTLSQITRQIEDSSPASLKVMTLLIKPEALKYDRLPEYVGFEIDNRFVVGYGLDYEGYGRNLSDIYALKT